MDQLTRNVLGPVLARAGTLITGYLVGTGAASDLAEKVAVGAAALVLIGIDLAIGYFVRGRDK